MLPVIWLQKAALRDEVVGKGATPWSSALELGVDSKRVIIRYNRADDFDFG